MNYKYSLFALLMLLISVNANAALVWNWQITNPTQVVGTDEIVTFEGVIANDISSSVIIQNLDETVDNTDQGGLRYDRLRLLAGSSPEIFDLYEFDIGPKGVATLQSQFAGVVINPGESFNFTLMSLAPSMGPVPAGVYEDIFASLSINIPGGSGNQLSNPVQVTVVPLPPAAYLFASSIMLGALQMRRRRSNNAPKPTQ